LLSLPKKTSIANKYFNDLFEMFNQSKKSGTSLTSIMD
jgi:hypothetical protein